MPLAALILVSATTAATAQITVEITEQDCSQLVQHVAAADVAYQPGVDVNGDAVAPADLNGAQQIPAPDVVSFPLTLDLADRLGISLGDGVDILARPVIGDVAITSDGRVFFNGNPLTSDEQFELAQKCQRIAAQP
jgi:hypothetical protein